MTLRPAATRADHLASAEALAAESARLITQLCSTPEGSKARAYAVTDLGPLIDRTTALAHVYAALAAVPDTPATRGSFR